MKKKSGSYLRHIHFSTSKVLIQSLHSGTIRVKRKRETLVSCPLPTSYQCQSPPQCKKCDIQPSMHNINHEILFAKLRIQLLSSSATEGQQFKDYRVKLSSLEKIFKTRFFKRAPLFFVKILIDYDCWSSINFQGHFDLQLSSRHYIQPIKNCYVKLI